MAVALLLGACRTAPERPLERHAFKRIEMGLMFHVTLYAPSREAAETAAVAAFDRIRELNAILSDYEDDSELNRLRHTSGSGRWVGVSQELWRVLREADRFSRDTGGAFDITAGPLIQLWKRARRQRALPDPERLAEARTRVGHYYVGFRPRDRSVVLWRKGMRPDLGGIAKGFAMDEAMQVLRRRGIRRALISGGGDMVAGDPPPGRPAWKVELPSLDQGATPRFLALRNGAFAASGDRFQFVILDGRRYSHIVDPRTGQALSDRTLAYVVAPSGMVADALATASSVLGATDAIAVARQRGAEISLTRLSGDDREGSESPGFARHLWKADSVVGDN